MSIKDDISKERLSDISPHDAYLVDELDKIEKELEHLRIALGVVLALIVLFIFVTI